MANAELESENDVAIKDLAQSVVTGSGKTTIRNFLAGHPAHMMVMEVHEEMKWAW